MTKSGHRYVALVSNSGSAMCINSNLAGGNYYKWNCFIKYDYQACSQTEAREGVGIFCNSIENISKEEKNPPEVWKIRQKVWKFDLTNFMMGPTNIPAMIVSIYQAHARRFPNKALPSDTVSSNFFQKTRNMRDFGSYWEIKMLLFISSLVLSMVPAIPLELRAWPITIIYTVNTYMSLFVLGGGWAYAKRCRWWRLNDYYGYYYHHLQKQLAEDWNKSTWAIGSRIYYDYSYITHRHRYIWYRFVYASSSLYIYTYILLYIFHYDKIYISPTSHFTHTY